MTRLVGGTPDRTGGEGDPSTTPQAGPARRVAEAGLARAAKLSASRAWTDQDDAELDRRFEAAAVAALRVPALAERSARLRRVGRRVVPAPLRPTLRGVAHRLDRGAALLLRRYEAARGGRR